MLTAQDIYVAARTLSLPERLRLAALLLDELDQPGFNQVDLGKIAGYDDAWSEEDIDDLRRFSTQHLLTEDLQEAEQDDALPLFRELAENEDGTKP